MKQKTITILAGIAAALQTAALLLAVFMTVNQSVVKHYYNQDEKICSVKSFPTGAFIEILLPLFIYAIFLLCIAVAKIKASQRRILVIVFAVLAVLFKALASLILVPFSTMLQARLGGVAEFASYNALTQAISYVTFLFTVTAFAVFCMAVGSCLPAGEENAAFLQSGGQEGTEYNI